MRQGLLLLTVVALISGTAAAQTSMERDRARPYVRTAWEFMRNEAWPDAAKSFQQAIETDREFEDAYYGLGLAQMRMKKYAEAIAAYLKCRDLYRAQAGKKFTNTQDAQRYRQDRLTEIDEQIRMTQTGPQSLTSQDRVRQLQDQRRQIQDFISRSGNVSIENSVPAFVSVALGSAYFRTAQFADAEREYKAAIAADPGKGEAYSNLAVVYLQTGRYKEADDAVKAAEKAGYKVHPQLKQDIKAKLAG
jgi:tetratricopeptide (TPR) repeat protein